MQLLQTESFYRAVNGNRIPNMSLFKQPHYVNPYPEPVVCISNWSQGQPQTHVLYLGVLRLFDKPLYLIQFTWGLYVHFKVLKCIGFLQNHYIQRWFLHPNPTQALLLPINMPTLPLQSVLLLPPSLCPPQSPGV